VEFDLVIHGWTKEASSAVHELAQDVALGISPYKYWWNHNVGQHVIMNMMIEKAKDEGYEFLLRLDDDCKFVTKRWLAKLVDASKSLGGSFIVSPTILGLKHLPERSETVEVEGIEVKFLFDAIGGVCRLHNVANLTDPEYPYVADVRMPLGFGDATGIGVWCKNSPKEARRWMVYLDRVRVKHSTYLQEKEDKVYYKQHDMFQQIPYIPPHA